MIKKLNWFGLIWLLADIAIHTQCFRELFLSSNNKLLLKGKLFMSLSGMWSKFVFYVKTYRNLHGVKITFILKYNKEDVVWLPMRQLSTRDQMTQKLTILGQPSTFNNEKSSLSLNSLITHLLSHFFHWWMKVTLSFLFIGLKSPLVVFIKFASCRKLILQFIEVKKFRVINTYIYILGVSKHHYLFILCFYIIFRLHGYLRLYPG